MGFDGLSMKRITQFLPHGRVVDVGQLAPIRKSIVVATDPLDCLPLQESIVLARSLLHYSQIDDSLMPGLLEYGNCEVSFGSEIRLMSLYFCDV